jgi:hypothetical protein
MAHGEGFEGAIVLGHATLSQTLAGVGDLASRFVRYPGSQQVTLWLPQDGYAGYSRFCILGPGGAVIDEADVTARLNGRVQILIDTFPWPPGAYRIEIDHSDGWRHVLPLEKLEAGIAPPPEPQPAPEPSTGPIVYRDGFGNILPDEDLEMRVRVLGRMVSQFGRHLEFDGNARAGTIIYSDGDIRIPFPHEMCAGRVHISVDLPTPQRWESVTGRPIAEREAIIAFVAAETQRQKASRWAYEIYDDRIDFVDP